MKRILLLVLTLWGGYAFAQSNVPATASAQQAQENEWAKKLFTESYKEEQHEKYTGKIRINSNAYNFDKSVLILADTKAELKTIVAIGLIHPKLFEAELSDAQNDTLKISQIEELPFLNVKSTTKRFRFSSSRKNSPNPTIYFFELTNEKATVKTNISTFIKGSSLTFFTDGWTQI